MNWNRLAPQNWNDTLSLFLVIGIPILWLVAEELPESAIGKTFVESFKYLFPLFFDGDTTMTELRFKLPGLLKDEAGTADSVAAA